MEWNYAVTWESLINPPITIRGTIEASNYKAAVGKAVRVAAKLKPGRTRFQSLVVLIDKAELAENDQEAPI